MTTLSPDSAIGRDLGSVTVQVERGRLRAFAHATGQMDPVYTDLRAANAAGHPDLPVPPTFLFCLEMEKEDPLQFLEDLDIPLPSALHGEQSFRYKTLCYAGDVLELRTVISDLYEKKGGALRFVERTTQVLRGDEVVAELVGTLISRREVTA